MTRHASTLVAGLGVGLVVVLAGAAHAATRDGTTTQARDVVLVTHDSFAIPKDVKAAFEQQTGYRLSILQGGDAG